MYMVRKANSAEAKNDMTPNIHLDSDPAQPAESKQLPRLTSHRSGKAKRLPSEAKLRQHVTATTGDHWVMRPYRGKRWFCPRSGQAIVKLDGAVWNLARALLQVRGVNGTSFENTCGHVDCVNPSHWRALRVEPRAFSILHVGGTWRLCNSAGVVRGDVVLSAGVPAEGVVHVVRALYTVESTSFVTACGIAPAPDLLVPRDEATCVACLR